MAWEQVSRLEVGGNYVCCLLIIVIFMGLEGAKRYGRGFKLIVWREAKGGNHKIKGRGALFIGELIPQVFYQNYLSISASFDLKIVL